MNVIPIKNAHALLSPSGAEGWMTCVGKPAMERGKPDDSNEYSDEGTCAHGVAAMCLTEGKPATAYIGRRIEVGPHRTYEFREDMAAPTQCYVDAVLELKRQFVAQGASVSMHVEVRVPIGHITGEEDAEGTSDTVLIATFPDGSSTAVVIDLKFGQGVRVDAVKNKQGMLYALGTLRALDPLDEITTVLIVIHQPRIAEEPSQWQCTVAELQEFAYEAGCRAREAIRIYKGEMGPGPVGLRAGGHCKKTFCKARATCPALASFVQENVGADFEVIPVMAEGSLINNTVTIAEDDNLGKKMAATSIIEDWIKAVRAETERRLLAGVEVPGYKLVKGRQGDRAWTSKDEAEKLLKSFRLKQEEMYKFTLISPTAAEKVLKESPKRWAKAETLITRSEGAISVAPVSDKRPAITIAPPVDDFDTVGEVEDLL